MTKHVDVNDSFGSPLASLLRVRQDTAEPIYQQLARQIEGLIASGSLPSGATLPAERHLAESLGLSRTTVQNCYNSLRQSGILESRGRHGSIVQAPPRTDPGMDRLKGFTEEMRELGRVPSSRILEAHVTTSPVASEIFGAPSTSRFLRLVRVRCGDGVPLSFENAWYNLAAAPELPSQDLTGSLYDVLGRLGVRLVHCEQTIEAATPDAEACQIFDFDEPLPCLMIRRKSYAADDRMIEYVEGLFRGDAYAYRLKLRL